MVNFQSENNARLWRMLRRTVCFVLAWYLCATTSVTGQDSGLAPLRIDCGLSSSDFSRLNEAEAKAAFTVYSEVIGRELGYAVTFHTVVYRDMQDLQRDLEQRQNELLSLEVVWYANESIGRHVTPAMVPEESPGVVLDTYVLLARRDEGPAAVSDLLDATVLYIEHEDANLGKIWLDLLLMEQGLPPSEGYAGAVRKVHKSSSAVLPVFFGKADACVVDRSSFETMCELNPQVGRTLKVIAESDPVLDTVICLNSSGSLTAEEEGNVKKALLRLKETPEGEQILTMFGITGFVPIREGQLDSALELLRRHDLLRRNHLVSADNQGQ